MIFGVWLFLLGWVFMMFVLTGMFDFAVWC